MFIESLFISPYLCVIITPLNRPHVDTLKSRYAVESNELLAMLANFRLGLSSISRIGGQLFGSIDAAASRVLSNLMIL